jgi:hypothetical protein
VEREHLNAVCHWSGIDPNGYNNTNLKSKLVLLQLRLNPSNQIQVYLSLLDLGTLISLLEIAFLAGAGFRGLFLLTFTVLGIRIKLWICYWMIG